MPQTHHLSFGAQNTTEMCFSYSFCNKHPKQVYSLLSVFFLGILDRPGKICPCHTGYVYDFFLLFGFVLFVMWTSSSECGMSLSSIHIYSYSFVSVILSLLPGVCYYLCGNYCDPTIWWWLYRLRVSHLISTKIED